MGGSASSDVGSGVRDYGSAAHCSAMISGQRTAQKPAAAVERVNVMRRAEMTSRAPAREARARAGGAGSSRCRLRARHGAAGDVHQLIGHHRDQHPHLVAGEGIDGRGGRARLAAAHVGLGAVRGRQGRIQHILQL